MKWIISVMFLSTTNMLFQQSRHQLEKNNLFYFSNTQP